MKIKAQHPIKTILNLVVRNMSLYNLILKPLDKRKIHRFEF